MGRKFSRDSGMDVFVIVVVFFFFFFFFFFPLLIRPSHASGHSPTVSPSRDLPSKRSVEVGDYSILSIKRRKNINRNSSEKGGGMIYLCH